MRAVFLNVSTLVMLMLVARASAFEGRITATLTQDGQSSSLLYTVGTNELRIESVDTNAPHCRNVVDLKSGAIMLVFPHNQSFVRIKPMMQNAAMPPGFSRVPVAPPPGIGPQPRPPGAPAAPNLVVPPSAPVVPNLPPGVGPQSTPGAPAMPAMPMMPRPTGPRAEFKATGETTNILGFVCSGYEVKQRGATLSVWATDKLCPYRPYLQTQPPRSGPGAVVEPWSEPLVARKLFPLLATLRTDAGFERLRFEVDSVVPEKINDPDGQLFQPPADYHEIEPMPF
jgi:hypothetical protein